MVAASGVNLSNLRVDQDGRVSLSGISSQIDFATAVDDIIAARRTPIDLIIARQDDNRAQITAFGELSALVKNFQNSLDGLRNKLSFQDRSDLFANKQAFFSSARSDNGTASQAATLIGAAVTRGADAGIHHLEILSVAQAHRIASSLAQNANDDLGLAFNGGSGSISGRFFINDQAITVDGGDNLLDLVDQINRTADIGVRANLIQAGASGEQLLILTATQEGQAIQLASAQRAHGATVADATENLAASLGISGSGSFTLGGALITIDENDSLEDLATRISQAQTDFSAEIRETADGSFRLELIGTHANAALAFADDSASFLQDLGFAASDGSLIHDLSDSADPLLALGLASDRGATITQTLRTAQNARFTLNEITDQRRLHSLSFPDPSVELASLGISGDLIIETPAGPLTFSTAGHSLNSLAAAINGDATLQAAGISANLLTDDQGSVLELSIAPTRIEDPNGVLAHRSASADEAIPEAATLDFIRAETSLTTITFAADSSLEERAAIINGDATLQAAGISAQVITQGNTSRLHIETPREIAASGAVTTALGLAPPRHIFERSSNEVSDAIPGVTLNLFAAEPGTTIELTIEQDVSTIRQGITDFVDRYNSLRRFINQNSLSDSETGARLADSGALFRDQTLVSLQSNLGRVITGVLEGAVGADQFNQLSQIGITLAPRDASDPLIEGTLVIDPVALEESLIARFDEVRALFGLTVTSAAHELSLVASDADQPPQADEYQIDITVSGGVITAATIDGLADSVTIDGSVLIVNDNSPAAGLRFHYGGDESLSSTFSVTTGIAARLYAVTERATREGGTIASEIDNLTDINENHQENITRLVTRFENERKSLLDRFIAMETAIAALESTRQTLIETFAALNRDN